MAHATTLADPSSDAPHPSSPHDTSEDAASDAARVGATFLEGSPSPGVQSPMVVPEPGGAGEGYSPHAFDEYPSNGRRSSVSPTPGGFDGNGGWDDGGGGGGGFEDGFGDGDDSGGLCIELQLTANLEPGACSLHEMTAGGDGTGEGGDDVSTSDRSSATGSGVGVGASRSHMLLRSRTGLSGVSGLSGASGGTRAASVATGSVLTTAPSGAALFELPLPGVAVSVKCWLGDTSQLADDEDRVNAVHVFLRYPNLEVSPMVFVFAEQFLQVRRGVAWRLCGQCGILAE